MHERVRSHSVKEWGINKVKGQGGYFLGVKLQQCAKPDGLWALFQRITKAAFHRLGRQATKGWERQDWLRSSCHNAGIED